MKPKEKAHNFFALLKFHAWLMALVWTACVAGSLLWNLHEQADKSLKMARSSAQLTFENDVLYRRWAAQQGGVYVPVSEHTPPNPYLKVPQRDVTTTSGSSLTLVNPAYMARLVHELAGETGGTRGHITSLRPLRPENSPDEWEAAALRDFEKGLKEASSVQNMGDGEYLRLMRPFVTEKACLKCHAAQGYKEGDIRGGISVSVPMAPLRAIEKPMTGNLTLAHMALWMTGLGGIGMAKRRLGKQVLAREQVESALRESEARFRALFENMQDGFAHCQMAFDDEGRAVDFIYLNVNSAFGRLTGLENVVGKRVTEILPGIRESHPELLDTYGRVARTGHSERLEMEFKPLGMWLTISVYSPQPGHFAAVFDDITERKRSEEALRASNEELTRFNRAVVGRELRMIELKKEVNELCGRLGQTPRYTLDVEKTQP